MRLHILDCNWGKGAGFQTVTPPPSPHPPHKIHSCRLVLPVLLGGGIVHLTLTSTIITRQTLPTLPLSSRHEQYYNNADVHYLSGHWC
jgi:hypothetical protein